MGTGQEEAPAGQAPAVMKRGVIYFSWILKFP